ncbi:MAG: hypothetical protein HY675_19925 [Chloroflexi bacterium]|nr:hypothetical protein [Chloroflexota bacterium]
MMRSDAANPNLGTSVGCPTHWLVVGCSIGVTTALVAVQMFGQESLVTGQDWLITASDAVITSCGSMLAYLCLERFRASRDGYFAAAAAALTAGVIADLLLWGWPRALTADAVLQGTTMAYLARGNSLVMTGVMFLAPLTTRRRSSHALGEISRGRLALWLLASTGLVFVYQLATVALVNATAGGTEQDQVAGLGPSVLSLLMAALAYGAMVLNAELHRQNGQALALSMSVLLMLLGSLHVAGGFDVGKGVLWTYSRHLVLAIGYFTVLFVTVRESARPVTEAVPKDRQFSVEGHQFRAMKQSELRNDFVSLVSHDLRTPLTTIKGYVSTLLQEDVKWTEDQQRGFLRIVGQEADRLNRLVRDLLDLSTIASGTLRIERDWGSLSDTVDVVTQRLSLQLAGHKLCVQMPEADQVVPMDHSRVEQVLTNLVENAAKYSPSGSVIAIRAQQRNEEVLISVADQGVGIDPSELPRIFDKFYQAGPKKDSRGAGVGLGLAICRGFVEAHGGQIWAESEPGKGSTFYFTLPLTLGDAGPDDTG